MKQACASGGDGCRPLPAAGSPNRGKAALLLASVPLLLGVSLLLGPSGLGLPDTSTSIGQAILSLRFGRFFMGLDGSLGRNPLP